MEIVIEIKKENLQKAKEILLKDDVVSRATIIFKEAKTLGFDNKNYYCYISGLEEQCEKAKELIKDISKLIENEKKDEIIKKIKEEENTALEGFGNIFG
ncbi:MAG: hypothetical protein J7J93_03235 [Candidatus Aenigmarchaeota archaeon]|nr:hypothetical protein [Candidatus Aenigmarchaeota archaeon]